MPTQSLASRAFIAILLTIGFYVLALGIAGGLLYVVYAQVVYTHHFYARLSILAIVAAFVILWSILPRFDRFQAPGPLLIAHTQADLFAVVREVAAATGQTMPSEVYLVGDVNAWVAQRGGLAGFGSRRVMGIGLPLLQSLTIAQFRAVLAHEFGHYHGGDTALGPWIYRTRETIRMTIVNLVKTGSRMHAPFVWYGNMFLRVTQAISRAQELAADRLGATMAGGRNMIDALVATEKAGLSFDAYWSSEVVPLLSNGFRPRIATGLGQFMKAASIEKELGDVVQKRLAEDTGDVYDSHPPLRVRVAALEPLGGDVPTSPSAMTLLCDVEHLEHELVASVFNDPSVAANLRPVEWEETASTVYEPIWRETAAKHAKHLAETSIAAVPELVAQLPEFAVKIGFRGDDALLIAESVIGAAIATRLIDNGWVADSVPGSPITVTKDGASIRPFLLLSRLRRRELTALQWHEAFLSHAAVDIRLG